MPTQQQSSPANHDKRDAAHLSALLHRIYEASVQPEKWKHVVADIAASFGSTKALLFTNRLPPQHGGLLFPVGISESALQLWASKYIDEDIWSDYAIAKRMWIEGAVVNGDVVVPQKELLASKFYREFLSTIGIGRVCWGVVFEGGPGLPSTAISIFRDVHEPVFDKRDEEWLQIITTHLSRALGIMFRLDTARLRHVSLLASFDRLDFGVVLLDANMRVIHLNQSATAAMNRKDGLSINRDRQLASASSSSDSLTQWLTTFADTDLIEQGHFHHGYLVKRSGGSRYSVQCFAIPDAANWSAVEGSARYVVLITAPDALKLPDAMWLSARYNLTPTEARVALAFANGMSYRDTADKLGITEETVRAHVKQIYPKMGIQRQADLVRLVLSLSQCAV